MLAAIILATALGATPPSNDCTKDAKGECATLMGVLFHSADPVTGGATRLAHRHRWQVAPILLVPIADRRALVVSNTMDIDEAAHVESGTWSVYYFAPNEPRLLSAARDFEQTGSFGDPGNGTLQILADGTPLLAVSAGGTWQGYTCSWASMDVIEARTMRPLLAVITDYTPPDHRGGFTSSFVQLSLTGALLEYSNGRRLHFRRDAHGSLRPVTAPPEGC